jgi:predicted DNA-binding mobile mystery protein A
MNQFRAAQRRLLDERLARHLDLLGPPPGGGWVRAIREALGMSQFELGERAGVSQPRVAQIEHAEVEGTIELATLGRAAAALGCSLSYAIVPCKPLEAIIQERALQQAGGDPALAEDLVDQPRLWRGHGPRRQSPPEEGR